VIQSWYDWIKKFQHAGNDYTHSSANYIFTSDFKNNRNNYRLYTRVVVYLFQKDSPSNDLAGAFENTSPCEQSPPSYIECKV